MGGSLRDQVTRALRAATITGRLRPGVVYSAPVLAEELGVSATPVREAMLDLVREGLVETVRNKGFRVVGITDQDLDHVTEVRELIEIPATVEVARRARAEDLEQLRAPAQETVEAARTGDVIGYVEADRRFHLGVLALTGNRHLVATVGELRKRSRLFGLADAAGDGRLLASAVEHERLLELMLAGDLDGTRRLVRTHLGHVRTGRTATDRPSA
ncbi:GntR family transcriptional regulator [Streptacidiphilus sp. PB12-B1b]|uniref:GntR family transcriptional regulator n=1 Tax=Streptacidiphilus sp. PB12-B1b TaxID=2705012 RepID=UPI0015FDA0BE|nr:GntR family transcriptional regulator [Streptacidiphilus sp. PB12-B1b]QMU80175.1 GntR family transcriptional regulator [Streptacidiphilus sp. PB12-B1b]